MIEKTLNEETRIVMIDKTEPKKEQSQELTIEFYEEMFKFAAEVEYDEKSVFDYILKNERLVIGKKMMAWGTYITEISKIQIVQTIRAEERAKFLGAIEYLKEITI